MKSITQQITLCTFGTLFEWYDFSLFAALAPIFAEIFFPHSNHFAAMMSTFVVFASGFFMRPMGAIFFGHLGDRIGRKSTLLITVLMMTISTTAIGFIPVDLKLSALLLVIFRLVQGFAASGEYPGGITLLAEKSQTNKGFISSFGIFAAPAGIFIGTLICIITSKLLEHDQMIKWGWRIPFLIGAPLGLVGYLIRKTLLESEIFQSAKKEKILLKIPLVHLIKNHFKEFIALSCLYIFTSVSFYMNFVYLGSYFVVAHKMTAMDVLYLNSITTFIYAIAIPFFGWFSDYLGRRKLLMISACFFIICFIYPLFLVILNEDLYTRFIAQSLIAIIIAMFTGPLAILSAECFPTEVRYTGISISLNISAAIFGGTAPLICAWLTKLLNNAISPVYYFIFIATLALIAIFYLNPPRENYLL